MLLAGIRVWASNALGALFLFLVYVSDGKEYYQYYCNDCNNSCHIHVFALLPFVLIYKTPHRAVRDA